MARKTPKRPARQASFKARSRILALLGDQLIGNDQLAVFELVKNSYDADASQVTVELAGLDSEPRVVVQDDGEGMDINTILDIWLEPGNEHREIQRFQGKRSTKFNRLPLGEKGVGRFAVHKLGNIIELTTRQTGGSEYRVHINWAEVLKKKYLSDVRINVSKVQPPETFPGTKHGTRIEISDLRQKEWKRGDIRRIQRLLTSINSPFEEQAAFATKFLVPERQAWIEDLPSVKELLEQAPWEFSFTLKDGEFSWEYEFQPPPGIKIEGRNEAKEKDTLLLPSDPGQRNKVVADLEMTKGIGTITGKFVAYDKDPKIRKLLPQISMVTDFLDNWSGIRVYRDGMRVFNYGEPNDDWLGLDLRRVNRPTERLSRNIVVGAIYLTLSESGQLREKTNREGFDESPTFIRFRELVRAAVSKFEVERDIDKDRLKKAVEESRDALEIPVEKPLRELRNEISKLGMEDRLFPYVNKVERDYLEMRELMLKAGMAGLNLAVIFHEAERAVRSLYESIHRHGDAVLIETQASSLMKMFEDITSLLRKKTGNKFDIREVVQTAARLSAKRFERHNVHVTYDLPDENHPLLLRGSADLVLGTLTNLIDNSIYWLRVRWPNTTSLADSNRRIHISINDELGDGKTLVVSDNGIGLQDEPETLTRPFFTRRPDGIGLGLYYGSMAQQLNGGELVFPQKGDLPLSKEFDGAAIGLFFPSNRIEK